MKPVIQQHIQEEGIRLWEEIARALNGEILLNGRLQKNNAYIWGQFLHRWRNLEYAQVLGVMRELMDTNPELFKSFHESAVLTAEQVLIRNWDKPTGKDKVYSAEGRILDQRAHKEVAWKLIMTMREVWNKIHDMDIANDDSARMKPQGPKSDLFNLE
jgi:hypothetical protein